MRKGKTNEHRQSVYLIKSDWTILAFKGRKCYLLILVITIDHPGFQTEELVLHLRLTVISEKKSLDQSR